MSLSSARSEEPRAAARGFFCRKGRLGLVALFLQAPMAIHPRSSERRILAFSRPLRQAAVTLLLVTFLLTLSGCRIIYLFRAAAGQVRLLHGAIPVEEALKLDSLSENHKVKLALVEKVKGFGETELGLKETENYGAVNLDPDRGRIYALSASPKDRLLPVTWWFPLVGSLPYLGFFDLESARREQRKLIENDLDTVIGRVDAYSTLGWFKDPLTLNLIENPAGDLVDTILHEMTHATLYLKGQGEFNEGLATLVGKNGAYLFLRETFGPSHPLTLEAQKTIEDERLFSFFLDSLLNELNQLYDSSLSYQEKLKEREKVFALYLERFNSLRGSFQTSRFTHFGKAPLNNAVLVSLAVYHRHYPLFEMALRQSGNSIQKLLGMLERMSKEEKNMIVVLQEWLGKSEVYHSPDSEALWKMSSIP
jgi:predicted aminopeptidase